MQQDSMSNTTENPYAAPADDFGANVMDTQLPISTYFYAAVLFFIGSLGVGFGTFLLLIPVTIFWEPAVLLLMWVPLALGGIGGTFAARQMYCRLADLHRQKVELQMADAERLGELYTW